MKEHGRSEPNALAAKGFAQRSSAARAFWRRRAHPEGDCLIRRFARQQGFQSDKLDEIVTLVDERLAYKRAAGAAKRD